MTEESMADQGLFDFVVVSNRLPVDSVLDANGNQSWTQSPGGLVAALEPVMRQHAGALVGWPGRADLELEPFDTGGMRLVPVPLSSEEVEDYYEGFSNDTLWPLYHDVIAVPTFERTWWDAYKAVNARFAERTAEVARHGAVVWVQDYQLQLVPKLLRAARPDLTIGFFNHIPFPSYGLFSQLPWRVQIIEGLLGADVVGFQRDADASNFQQAVRDSRQPRQSGNRDSWCRPARLHEGHSPPPACLWGAPRRGSHRSGRHDSRASGEPQS